MPSKVELGYPSLSAPFMRLYPLSRPGLWEASYSSNLFHITLDQHQ